MAVGEIWEARRGVSVTRRTRNLKPNLKIYIDPTRMDEFPYDDGIELGRENINQFIGGNGCRLPFRLNNCNDVIEAFHISILEGMNSRKEAELMGYLSGKDWTKWAENHLSKETRIGDPSSNSTWGFVSLYLF